MIHRISSTLPSFKNLEFRPGLNVLIARKEAGATDKQTRNRAGKSSLIEIIHFLTGANAGKESLFRSEAIVNETFAITLDVGDEELTAERSGKDRSKVYVERTGRWFDRKSLSQTQWAILLGEKMFQLNTLPNTETRVPTFRSLFAYFVRRQQSEAFATPEKNASQQKTGDHQVSLLYLLDLDWQLASKWQEIRDREKTLGELRKAAAAGTLGSIIGRASDLRTQLAVAEGRLKELQSQLEDFRVLPQYAALESEADDLTRQINDCSNANVVDTATIRDMEAALRTELPPPTAELEHLYAEAGVTLPRSAIKRYDDVRAFHESIIRNRQDYLSAELEAAKQRIAAREHEKRRLDERRAQLMKLLSSHGALEQFSSIQAQTARQEADVESLRQRFASAEQLEGTKNELTIERTHLLLRLRRDFADRHERLSKAILAFEETSQRLYESAGSMTLEETANGPQFQFPMQGARSKGIRNMQIFCFDMMLMQLCAERNIGTGVLVHDSHLFDGVDGRQVVSALKVGAETAEELGFQYLVTMNEDDAFKETTRGFDIRDHVLPIRLTDAKQDGGLFGIRF